MGCKSRAPNQRCLPARLQVGPWQAAASGALLLLGAALLSGFAGAWTERLLKQAVGPEEESWWAKNARLSAMSVPLALLCTLVVDLQHLRRSGFFSGYTAWTWAVVALQVPCWSLPEHARLISTGDTCPARVSPPTAVDQRSSRRLLRGS